MFLQIKRQPIYIFILWILLLGIVSCSGSSLDSDTDQAVPDILVNAGANQSVNEQTSIALNGTASGRNGGLTFQWTVSPAVTVVQDSNESAAASFVSPIVTEVQSYVFTLLVTDVNGNQASDTVQYEINPVNESPSAIIATSSDAAQVNGRFPAGSNLVLSGSASSDADPQDTLDPIAAYRWQQTAGLDVLTGISQDGDSIAFTAPIADERNDITLELKVTDQEGAQDTEAITLQFLSASETLPSVNAGNDHQVFSGEIILLTGQATTTIPAGRPLLFNWLNDSELVPTITNKSADVTYAVAPLVTQTQLVTFTFSVTDTFGNKVDDSVSVRIKPLPLVPINDTGVILQADLTRVGTQHQAQFPGQDGQRGKDIVSENGLLEKAGRGEQGFDFTRLDSVGDEQDDTSQPWECVRDNVTGLVWEVKTLDTNLHSSEHDYSWLAEENNGGFAGQVGTAGVTCSGAQCDTQTFVTEVNQQGLCNFFDWRLPTHSELLSLVHFGNVTGTRIDLEYFPNTDDFVSTPLWYWTSQPGADGVSDVARTAWALDFDTGNDNFLNKTTLAKVRLVRGGR